MKRGTLIRAIGIAVSGVCLAYFAIKVSEAWQSAGAGLTAGTVLRRLAAASLPLLLGYATSALAWVALMRGLGVHVAPLPGSGIYLTAQFAKYVPGNVGHYVGRVVLSVRRGYSGTMTAVSMTLELGLLLALAAVFSMPLLGAAWEKFPAVRLATLVLATTALTGSAFLFAMRNKPALLTRAPPWLSDIRAAFGRAAGLKCHALAAALLALGIVLSSLSLAMLEADAGRLPLSELASVLSIFSVAWIAGVLTPGAPAGLGVREAVLVEGLAPLMGASDAAGCALLFRLLTTLADAATFATGLLLLKLAGPPDAGSVTAVATRRESAGGASGGAPHRGDMFNGR